MTKVFKNNRLGAGLPTLRIVAITAVLGVLSACTSAATTSSNFVEKVVPAPTLYNQALANMDAGDMKRAKQRLDQLDRQHPYSEYSRKSMILSTFILYRQGQYPDAINSAKRFLTLYPGDKDAAYAQYLTGMSYFKQMPHVTRDQQVTARAYNAMNAVAEKYPDSEYVEDAKRKRRITFDQLAGKEMQVGRYYQERREFLAAINRFRRVVETMQTTRHVEEALARLVETYYSLGLVDEAQTAASVLGHNFPDSQWYKDSYALLQTGGLEPRENSGSWLSQAFKTPPKSSG